MELGTSLRMAARRFAERPAFPRPQGGDVPGCGVHEISVRDIETIHRGVAENRTGQAAPGHRQ
jgi:hypothetical protein